MPTETAPWGPSRTAIREQRLRVVSLALASGWTLLRSRTALVSGNGWRVVFWADGGPATLEDSQAYRITKPDGTWLRHTSPDHNDRYPIRWFTYLNNAIAEAHVQGAE